MTKKIFKKVLLLIFLFLQTISATADTNLQLKLDPNMDPRLAKIIEDAKLSSLSAGASFEIVGTLEKGNRSSFSINGDDFTVNHQTKIEGSLKIGLPATAMGKIVNNQKIATKILVGEIQSQLKNVEPQNIDTQQLRLH